MFKHEDTMCCSKCFEEMHAMFSNNEGKPILYICPNCGKVTDLTDEL